MDILAGDLTVGVGGRRPSARTRNRGAFAQRRRAGSAQIYLGAAICVVLLAACSGGSDEPAVTSTTPPAVSATAAPSLDDAVKAEVEKRYQEYWQVRLEANREPVNPDDPRLAQYATGQQLDNVINETRERQRNGLAIRRPEPSVAARRVKVLSVDGDEARLQDCATNDGVIYRVATGEVVDNKVVTRNVTATMRRIDGSWKLSEARVVQEWEGVAGCARSGDF